MGIIDINTKKTHKLCQELVDSTFVYLKAYRDGTPFQKTTSKKRLLKALEGAHELLEGSGKLIKIKPPSKVLIYKTPNKMVHIITKD